MTYRLLNYTFAGVTSQYLMRDDGNGVTTNIPFSEDNTDYQEYLAWVAEGNEPLPADN